MNRYSIFEIAPDGESHETGQSVTADRLEPDNVVSLIRSMELLPERISKRLSVDFDRGTWIISVRHARGERTDFRPVLMLVGPWAEAGG
jgi:hypothetical protein